MDCLPLLERRWRCRRLGASAERSAFERRKVASEPPRSRRCRCRRPSSSSLFAIGRWRRASALFLQFGSTLTVLTRDSRRTRQYYFCKEIIVITDRGEQGETERRERDSGARSSSVGGVFPFFFICLQNSLNKIQIQSSSCQPKITAAQGAPTQTDPAERTSASPSTPRKSRAPRARARRRPSASFRCYPH